MTAWNETDYGLTPEELQDKHGNQHACYTRGAFDMAGSTGTDYWLWVKRMLDYEEYCWGEEWTANREAEQTELGQGPEQVRAPPLAAGLDDPTRHQRGR